MSFALIYWILMLFWLLFGLWTNRANLKASGGDLILFILLLIVGWKVFGQPIHS